MNSYRGSQAPQVGASIFGVGSRVISNDDDLDTLNRGALYKRKEFLGVEEEGALSLSLSIFNGM